jgi:hypothetical protein
MISWNGHRFPRYRTVPVFQGRALMVDSEWPTRLPAAPEALERSTGASGRLKWALHNALAVAQDLVSRSVSRSLRLCSLIRTD